MKKTDSREEQNILNLRLTTAPGFVPLRKGGGVGAAQIASARSEGAGEGLKGRDRARGLPIEGKKGVRLSRLGQTPAHRDTWREAKRWTVMALSLSSDRDDIMLSIIRFRRHHHNTFYILRAIRVHPPLFLGQMTCVMFAVPLQHRLVNHPSPWEG